MTIALTRMSNPYLANDIIFFVLCMLAVIVITAWVFRNE